ncbi:MAG: tRNA 2-thiouridine(34) synthase MnmA, partial [Patescibacteria group bacterium]
MKIAVLVSGGVDSSVALHLLKQQGYDVTAFYLKIWLEDEMSFLGECPWEEDLSYVEKVCAQCDVELNVVPLQKEYHEKVVSYTIDSVKNGLTPNPDMLCNREVKFGAFYDKYGKDFDKIATGHYAQIEESDDENVKLKRAPDPVKDQTYFLAMMSQEQLQKAMFP